MKHSFSKLLLAIAVILAASGLAYAQTGPNNTPTIPNQVYTVVTPPQTNSHIPSLPSGQCDIAANPLAASCAANQNQAITNNVQNTWCPVVAGSCVSLCGGAACQAARSDPGIASPAIDTWNYCRYVDNAGTDSIFVPFNTAIEWQDFINNKPSFISLAYCSRPGTGYIPVDFQTWQAGTPTWPAGAVNPYYNSYPNLACDQLLPPVAVSLPYGRNATSMAPATNYNPPSAQFTCTVAGICDNTVTPPNCGANQQWTLTADATFTAVNAAPDNANTPPDGGWVLTNVAYSGNPPPANQPPPINGQCGPASGVSAPSAPSSGLCNAGNPTAVAGNGPWTWSCLGLDGGTDDTSCNAPGGNNIYCGEFAQGGGAHVGWTIIVACFNTPSLPQVPPTSCNNFNCAGQISYARCGSPNGNGSLANPTSLLNCISSQPPVSACTQNLGFSNGGWWYLCQ